MKVKQATYEVTLTDEEISVILEAIKHIRLDKDTCEANAGLIYNTSNIIDALEPFSKKATEVKQDLIKAYEEECDRLMGE